MGSRQEGWPPPLRSTTSSTSMSAGEATWRLKGAGLQGCLQPPMPLMASGRLAFSRARPLPAGGLTGELAVLEAALHTVLCLNL